MISVQLLAASFFMKFQGSAAEVTGDLCQSAKWTGLGPGSKPQGRGPGLRTRIRLRKPKEKKRDWRAGPDV